MFDPRIIALSVVGLVLIGSAGVERLIERLPISMPMIYVGIGWAVFSLPLGLPTLDPIGDTEHAKATEYLTEFIVIVSLMTAGLAIDRPASWKLWGQVWPLLLVAMPLTIAVVALAGWGWLALTPAAAILLGAAISPTDPVLADAVQVHPPGESERHDVRFTLTVEAGINDSLAFPFTYLAIAAIGATGLGVWTAQWLAMDVIWRLVAGAAVGYLAGRATSRFVFGRSGSGRGKSGGDGTEHGQPERDDPQEDDPKSVVRRRSEGLVAVGTVLASYGLAEMVEGYGFLAVFIAAVSLRQRELVSGHHSMMHRFVDQIEQITMTLMMLGFGGLLAGGVLSSLTWHGALFALTVVVLLRPLAGIVSMLGFPLPWLGRAMIAFAGIRGIGSIYYLSYGQNHGSFGDLDAVWSILASVVLLSIVVHGTSVSALMRLVEARGAHRKSDPMQGTT